jgi:anti-sigma B factor antagonist
MEISMTDAFNSAGTRHSELLRVQRQATGAGIVVHVAGELDLNTAQDLVDQLAEARAQARTPGPLVIDLTDLTFMGSVGLSVLLDHDRRCRDAELDLRVVAGNRTIARTFSKTGLHTILAVFATLAEALAPASPLAVDGRGDPESRQLERHLTARAYELGRQVRPVPRRAWPDSYRG